MYVPTFHHMYVPMYLRTHLPTCLPPGAPPPRRAGGCSGCWTQCPKEGATKFCFANKFEHAVASPGNSTAPTQENGDTQRKRSRSRDDVHRVPQDGSGLITAAVNGSTTETAGGTGPSLEVLIANQYIYPSTYIHTCMHTYKQTNIRTCFHLLLFIFLT